MEVSKARYQNELIISLDGRRMEEVNTHRYLGVLDVKNDVKMNEKVNHIIGDAKEL